MRRFLFWYLPVALALVCSVIFAYGFSLLFRNDIGTLLAPVVEREAETDRTKPLKIVLLGDSVARGAGDPTGEGIGGSVAKSLEERGVAHEEPLNLAVSGAETEDVLEQVESSSSIRGFIRDADVIILSIGGNDLYGDRTLRSEDSPPDPEAVMGEVEASVVAVVKRIRELNPDARIYYVGLYNPFKGSEFGRIVDIAVSEWQARLVRQFSDDGNVTVVQTFDVFTHNDRLSADRFHPGAEGYKIIGRRIADAI